MKTDDNFLSISTLYSAVCALGTLSPQTIQCGTGARRSREEYLGEVEFVSSNQDIAGLLTGFNKINANNGNMNTIEDDTAEPAILSSAFVDHNFGDGKDCGLPKKIDDGSIVYK